MMSLIPALTYRYIHYKMQIKIAIVIEGRYEEGKYSRSSEISGGITLYC